MAARKWTAEEIKEQVKRIRKATKKHKRQVKAGEEFTAVTASDVKRKLKRVKSPMIVSQSWNHAAPGGTITYRLGLYNPDPTDAIWLFAHVWVGPGNVDPDVGTFLLGVDDRFPRLTEPKFSGLHLAAGASANLSFTLQVPTGVERTNYLGNSCLMRFNWHDVGTYLDRGIFVFNVS